MPVIHLGSALTRINEVKSKNQIHFDILYFDNVMLKLCILDVGTLK